MPADALKSALSLLTVVVITALSTAGCGGDQLVSPESVAEAADATFESGGFRFGLTGTVEAAGEQVKITGTGVSSANGKRASLEARVGGPAGTEDLRMSEVFDGTAIYLKSRAFESELPEGKRWLKIDLAKTYKNVGLNLDQLTGPAGNNPRDSLQYLRALGDIHRMGTESVRGVETTHYKGTLNLSRAINRLKPSERKAARAGFQRLLKGGGFSDETPTEVWIDKNKLVRRERVLFSFEPVPGKKGTADTTMELFDFGTTVAVRVPAKDEVEDVTELASAEIRKRSK